MSFGFSVGDFVLAAEKGYAIWEKCARAPDDYRGLANAVHVLHDSLDKSKVFTKEEEGSLDRKRQEHEIKALVVARIASENTLEKVDRFLDKHVKVDDDVLKTLNFINRAAARGKFLFSGIDGLRRSVNASAELLDRALFALTSVSVKFICGKLEKIHQDCRKGLRARTVITAALKDGERVTEAEILEQVQKDLVDEDVHPDGIDLRFDFVRQWASEVANSGGLSDTEEEDDTGQWKDFEKLHTADTDVRERSPPLAQHVSPSVTNTEDELYASSVAPRDTHLQPPPERGRSEGLQTPSERAESRSSSLASHLSQDSNWRKHTELSEKAQRYVAGMLAKALTMQPFEPLSDIDVASMYFKRAFAQQDAYKRGYLTRPEATRIGESAVREAGVEIGHREIERVIDGYDDDRNAKIDRDEFIKFMHELRLQIHEGLSLKWGRLFDQTKAEAERKATAQRLVAEDSDFLHWGFDKEGPSMYMDAVEGRTLETRPPLLPPWSFTVMAYEAANCVATLDLAENEWWNRVLPDQTLRDQFHGTFSLIREIALRFVLFENKFDRSRLSDLDEMVSVVRVLAQTEGIQNLDGNPTADLCQARGKAHALLQHIVGFAYMLQSDDQNGNVPGLRPLGRPSAAGLSNHLKRWKDSHMETWANLISVSADDSWPIVDSAVARSREWYETKGGVSSPSEPVKSKMPLKSKLAYASDPDHQSLASASTSFHQNKLAESAMFFASAHCTTIRTAEQDDLEQMRAAPRRCRMSDFVVERRESDRGRWSFPTRAPKCVVYVKVGRLEVATPEADQAVVLENEALLPPRECDMFLSRESIVRLEVMDMSKRKVWGECVLHASEISIEKDDGRKRRNLKDRQDNVIGAISFRFDGCPDPGDTQLLTGPHPWFSFFEDAFRSP